MTTNNQSCYDDAANAQLIANKPLSGLEVVELHAIGPVPFAGMMLQNLGANITRISPPSDPGLGLPMDAKFDALNRGKSFVKLDLKSPTDYALVLQHIAKADVLLEGFRPGVLERLKLDPAFLMQKFPRLIIGRLSGWGSEGALGPRAGHDINYLALSGLLNAIGKHDSPHPPLNVVADFGGGAMHLAVGVLALLARRGITQKGGVAQTSILAGTVGLTPMFYGLMAGNLWNLERENNLLDGMLPFYRVYPTKDNKFVAVGALEPKFYLELLKVTGLQAQLAPKEQYKQATWARAIELFTQAFASRTRDEWEALSADTDACLSPVLNFSEATTHPHNQANQLHQSNSDGTHISNVISFL
jgi:alpha-methylacyl-CoA racemase